jgi:hypothetical protein
MKDYKKSGKPPHRLTHALALSVLLAALGAGLGSCGIETYNYLDPVESGIPMQFNTTAYIRLPGGQPPIFFRYFIIYYRIYISDLPVSGTVDTGTLSLINSTLASDYSYFYSYTNTTSTVAPSTMGTIFSGRKYYPLELASDSMDRLLGASSWGRVITLDFAANALPALIMADIRENPGAQRNLLSRNTRNENNPYAGDFYFVNSDNVNNAAHISSDSSNYNQDVQSNSQSGSGPKYTYVSMYILSYGLDNITFTNIYSIPTFIGIFRLPD